jgi:hypothetical protein
MTLTQLIDRQRQQLQAEAFARLEHERHQQAEALANAYAQIEAQRKAQQDMLVFGAVLLVVGLIVIAGHSGG